MAWYLRTAHGRWEGPGCVPFYADSKRVGAFAVELDCLRASDEEHLFRLLVLFALFQSRRDVDIMARQRATSVARTRAMTSPRQLRVLVTNHRCEHLDDERTFDASCDVRRDFARASATCNHRPRTPCHVKEATLTIGRYGDLGKLPTSAWLHLRDGGFRRLLASACEHEPDHPHRRATWVAAQLATIHRIGRKLASMYVSALCTDELTPGFAPWSPQLNGSDIVVVDANVMRVVEGLSRRHVRNYDDFTHWLYETSDQIDLSTLRAGLPVRSPRLIQQALYVFRSRSNRSASSDKCVGAPCAECPSVLCPFRSRV